MVVSNINVCFMLILLHSIWMFCMTFLLIHHFNWQKKTTKTKVKIINLDYILKERGTDEKTHKVKQEKTANSKHLKHYGRKYSLFEVCRRLFCSTLLPMLCLQHFFCSMCSSYYKNPQTQDRFFYFSLSPVSWGFRSGQCWPRKQANAKPGRPQWYLLQPLFVFVPFLAAGDLIYFGLITFVSVLFKMLAFWLMRGYGEVSQEAESFGFISNSFLVSIEDNENKEKINLYP